MMVRKAGTALVMSDQLTLAALACLQRACVSARQQFMARMQSHKDSTLAKCLPNSTYSASMTAPCLLAQTHVGVRMRQERSNCRQLTIMRAPTRIRAGPVAKTGMLAGTKPPTLQRQQN